ncbi:prp19 Pre-mRNA-processing factor 19 [Candida maltosa Xu316]
MICSISGEIATDPVVSRKSGAIFQRKHILNYISTNGTDPITNEPLSETDLIPIKTDQKTPSPPNPSNTSIPALLSTFQNEWDAIVLEVFTLRKQLQVAKEELSLALYKQDAAINVAAKAIRDRDEARSALEQLASSLSVTTDVVVNNNNNIEEDKSVQFDKITKARDDLFMFHKSQKVKFPFDVDTVLKLELLDTKSIFEGEKVSKYYYNKDINSIVGVCADKIIKYSFIDGTISYLDTSGVASLVSVSSNGTIAGAIKNSIVFSNDEIIELPNKPTQIIPHPSLDFFIIFTAKNWVVATTKSILSTHDEKLTLGTLHYDGEILAAKSGKEIQFSSILSGDKLGSFTPEHANVVKIEFASNGYWLLVLSNTKTKSTVQVYDLRKSTVVYTLDFDDVITNFITDPTASILVTFSKKSYTISRFTKKTKEWNHGTPQDLHDGLDPAHIELKSTVTNVIEDSKVELMSVDLKNNQCVLYKVSN